MAMAAGLGGGQSKDASTGHGEGDADVSLAPRLEGDATNWSRFPERG